MTSTRGLSKRLTGCVRGPSFVGVPLCRRLSQKRHDVVLQNNVRPVGAGDAFTCWRCLHLLAEIQPLDTEHDPRRPQWTTLCPVNQFRDYYYYYMGLLLLPVIIIIIIRDYYYYRLYLLLLSVIVIIIIISYNNNYYQL
ncbi:hypothetical protein EYF80_050689 [Liparis tanakae]|uniref:Uncharacterized protein n=1 Tax=Liparis tanakae TaxID=230148 RepID=A0A4Z2FE17_9TELE|nr:hypothetical protein EYF80_050689 [Liparis tanakae]